MSDIINSNNLQAVLLELTNRCNYGCQHCYSDSSPKNTNIFPFERIKSLSNELKLMGVTSIALSGGEPFLYPRIWDVLELLKNTGFKVIIDTNGMFCDLQTAQKLKNLDVDLVNVSLHGYSPQAHDRLIGSDGAFYKAIQSIETLSKYVPTGINVALNRYNMEEAHNIILIAVAYRVKAISFFRVFPSGRAKTNIQDLEISLEQHKNVFTNIKNVIEKVNVGVNLYTELPYIYWEIGWKKSYSCGVGATNFIIAADGSVYLCNALRISELRCGNIHEQTAEDIWQTAPTFENIRNIRNNPHQMFSGKCAECDLVLQCRGGCRACAYYVYGDLRQSDPYCWLHPVLTQ